MFHKFKQILLRFFNKYTLYKNFQTLHIQTYYFHRIYVSELFLFTQNLKCTCLYYSLHENNLNNFVTEFLLLSIFKNNLFYIIYVKKLQL